jgi:hypothetical protein
MIWGIASKVAEYLRDNSSKVTRLISACNIGLLFDQH